MFIQKITASVIELVENPQTHFQSVVSILAPIEMEYLVQPGMLLAAENIYSSKKEERYCVLQVLSSFPVQADSKRQDDRTIALRCKATPIGIELWLIETKSKKKEVRVRTADVLPLIHANTFALNDEMTLRVIHHLAPGSRAEDNNSRIDIGSYTTNPDVPVGLDATTLLRGNITIVSTRPRARTTITNNLIHALLNKKQLPLHIIYCDVNYQNTLSLVPEIVNHEHAHLLSLNDKFVPPSIFGMLKTPGDKPLFKRAVYDYLDMMILPSVLESRRKDFLFPIANIFKNNKLLIYRPHEPMVDEFINDIRVDILDGVDADVEELIGELMKGMSENFKGERFSEKNVHDMFEMIDELNQETKIHGARRILYDLRAEIQTIYESFAKDLPATVRMTLNDVVTKLNDETHSSLFVAQGQKSSDILRFVHALTNKLVEDRLRRLKLRVPILFVFNNADDYLMKSSATFREAGSERFIDILSTLLFHGRRHGLGFCLSLENCSSLDKHWARKIQSYFIGPIRYSEDLSILEDLLNISSSLLQTAVNYDDGKALFTSADSPYQRQVPLPYSMRTNQEILHRFLDESVKKQEQLQRDQQIAEQQKKRSPQTAQTKAPAQKQEIKKDTRSKRDRREKTVDKSSSTESYDQKLQEKNTRSGLISEKADTTLTIVTKIHGGFDDEENIIQHIEDTFKPIEPTRSIEETTVVQKQIAPERSPQKRWKRSSRHGQSRRKSSRTKTETHSDTPRQNTPGGTE